MQFALRKAYSSSAALEKLKEENTDLVLFDLNLDSPLLNDLKNLLTSFPDTPVIVLADLHHKEIARHALDIGVKDYIVKDQIDGRLLERIIVRNARPARQM